MMDKRQRRLHKETLDYLRINGDPDATFQDAMMHDLEECGRLPGTHHCTKAGSEHCDWDCPYR